MKKPIIRALLIAAYAIGFYFWLAAGVEQAGRLLRAWFIVLGALNLISIGGIVAYYQEGDRARLRKSQNNELDWFISIGIFSGLAWGGAVGLAIFYIAAIFLRDATARVLGPNDAESALKDRES